MCSVTNSCPTSRVSRRNSSRVQDAARVAQVELGAAHDARVPSPRSPDRGTRRPSACRTRCFSVRSRALRRSGEQLVEARLIAVARGGGQHGSTRSSSTPVRSASHWSASVCRLLRERWIVVRDSLGHEVRRSSWRSSESVFARVQPSLPARGPNVFAKNLLRLRVQRVVERGGAEARCGDAPRRDVVRRDPRRSSERARAACRT